MFRFFSLIIKVSLLYNVIKCLEHLRECLVFLLSYSIIINYSIQKQA